MNRKKKIKSTLLAKQKKANAKLHKRNKPKYISKAERQRLEAEQQAENRSADKPVNNIDTSDDNYDDNSTSDNA